MPHQKPTLEEMYNTMQVAQGYYFALARGTFSDVLADVLLPNVRRQMGLLPYAFAEPLEYGFSFEPHRVHRCRPDDQLAPLDWIRPLTGRMDFTHYLGDLVVQHAVWDVNARKDDLEAVEHIRAAASPYLIALLELAKHGVTIALQIYGGDGDDPAQEKPYIWLYSPLERAWHAYYLKCIKHGDPHPFPSPT